MLNSFESSRNISSGEATALPFWVSTAPSGRARVHECISFLLLLEYILCLETVTWVVSVPVDVLPSTASMQGTFHILDAEK
jgi:hypothetical protein